MAFLVSPGVEVKEIDLTNIVPAVSTSIGAYAGHFNWGPVGDSINLSSEKDLASYFGAPSKEFAQSFYTAATFLRYGEALLVSRAVDDRIDESYGLSIGSLNASSGNELGNLDPDLIGFKPANAPTLIRNLKEFNNFSETWLTANFYARCPGEYGNSIKVMIQPADTPIRFNVTKFEVIDVGSSTPSTKAVQITVDDQDNILENGIPVGIRGVKSRQDWINDIENDIVQFYIGDETPDGESSTKTFILYSSWIGDENGTGTVYDPDFKYPFGFTGSKTPNPGDEEATVLTPKITNGFMYAPIDVQDFETAFVTKPGTSVYAEERGAKNDEVHVLVIDQNGKFTGAPGQILERFANLSVAKDAKKEDGSTNYYKDIINTSSKYIFMKTLEGIVDFADDNIVDLVEGETEVFEFTSSYPQGGSIYQRKLAGGADGDRTNGNVYEALDLFADPETLDVNLVFAENDSEANITIANRLIRIAESRKDCVAFISPDLEVKDQATEDAKLDKVISKFDRLPSTSYAVFDSSPLYIYDKYHDEYIWVPASGTIAGLCARTDDVRDPWWSPAGYNRGQLLGVTKLAYNPLQSHRDELYKARINPIVSFPGEGIILFGDKTAQTKPSAFDRINVRRLFIVLEKAIATAAKYSLFEFNDEFTRAQFKNLVEPYLRDVQSRRGITDFLVVCDETNNTGEVIDSNRFIADIYIKPARAINFITLNFIATRTGVAFEEVVGQF